MSSLNNSNSPFKPRTQSPIVVPGGDMDNRTNYQWQNIAPNQVGGYSWNYIQNGDLFYTKSLSSRPGSVNICPSIDGSNNAISGLYIVDSIIDDTILEGTTFTEGNGTSRVGVWWINNSGCNVYNASFLMNLYTSVPYPNTQIGNIESWCNIYQVNASGSGSIIQGTGQSWDIALGAPLSSWTISPQLSGVSENGVINAYMPQGYVSQSASQIITPPWSGSSTAGSGNYNAAFEITYDFDPPFYMPSGSVFTLIPSFELLTPTANSFHNNLNINFQMLETEGDDPYPNLSLDILYMQAESGNAYSLQVNEISTPHVKFYPTFDVESYVSPSYMLVDNPTASINRYAPQVSGSIPVPGAVDAISVNQKTFATNSLFKQPQFTPQKPNYSIFETYPLQPTYDTAFNEGNWTQPEAANFGQILTVPSGVYTIYGAYFYANTQSGTFTNSAGFPSPITGMYSGLFSNAGAQINPSGYTVAYTMSLAEIVNPSGSISSGNFSCIANNLTTFSGSYTFNNPVSQPTTLFSDASSNLDKIQAVFPGGIQVSGGNYLLNIGLQSAVTGDPLTDYSLYYVQVGGAVYNCFLSPLVIGIDKNQIYSGGIVINNNGDGLTFEQNPQPNSINVDELTCGLVYVLPNNGITSIYNFENETNREQRTIVTQSGTVYAGQYGLCDWLPILSGAWVDNNLKWTHTTFQDQLISHQYGSGISQVGGSGGAIWDGINQSPTGYNSMQLHGLQPQVSVFGSGTYIPITGLNSTGQNAGYYYPFVTNQTNCQVMLGTQLESGGMRASIEYPFSGQGLVNFGYQLIGEFTNGLLTTGTSGGGNGSSGTYLGATLTSPYNYFNQSINGASTATLSSFISVPSETPVPFSGTLMTPSLISGTYITGNLAWNGSHVSGNFYGTIELNASGIVNVIQPNVTGIGINPPFVGVGAIQLTGIPIFVEGGTPGVTSQWTIPDVFPFSTYVFVTQDEGSSVAPDGSNLYYLAGLVDSLGNPLPNPLPNTDSWNFNGKNALYVNPNITGSSYPFGLGFGTFIADITSNGLVQQIPEFTTYSQAYFTEQVPVPTFKSVCVFENYVCGVGDINYPSRLWISQNLTSNIFGTDGVFANYIDIDLGGSPSGPNLSKASPITGMMTWKDFLYIFKSNSTYRLSPSNQAGSPFQITTISTTIGSLGFFGLVSTDNGIYGLSEFGPFLAGYYACQTIGDKILPYYSQLDHSNLILSTAIFDRERGQIYWSINPEFSSPDSDVGLCYSFQEQAWNVRQGNIWNAAGNISDPNNFSQLYVGDLMGQLNQISVGNTDQETLFIDGAGVVLNQPIQLIAEAPWWDLGADAQNLKRLASLQMNCETSPSTLRCDFYLDQNDDQIAFTRYMSMNNTLVNRYFSSGGPNFRVVKIILSTCGTPGPVQINSFQANFQDYGQSRLI